MTEPITRNALAREYASRRVPRSKPGDPLRSLLEAAHLAGQICERDRGRKGRLRPPGGVRKTDG